MSSYPIFYPTYAFPTTSLPPLSTDFGDGKSLQVFNAAAITELMEATARTKPRFLDLIFQKNRARRLARGNMSRAWYPSAISDEPMPEVDDDEPLPDAPRPEVEEEPGWYEKGGELCAISDEPFETRYDATNDRWLYLDAVRASEEVAEKFDIPVGSVIKAACLLCVGRKRKAPG